MTEYEKLTLLISGTALFISAISIYLASKANSKANALTEQGNKLAFRQARAKEHTEFAQAIFTVDQRLEKDLIGV